MRIETTESSIKLIEFYTDKGEWAVRWDFKPKLDEYGNETGLYWYEEEAYNFIPTIEDIQQTITNWLNKQTDGLIQHGFKWDGISVLLNEENKFNFKSIADEAARRETAIAIWDKENPELAGIDIVYIEKENEYGIITKVPSPTGRPKSLLPVTLKLGETNLPENFYTFVTLKELQEFFAKGVDHLLAAYAAGWTKIASFDWMPYVKALEEL